MNYNALMQQRLDRFKQILTILPQPEEIPAELLVLSAGEETSAWSYRHVTMPGDTLYFIFRKAGFVDGNPYYWECVDRELDEVMQEYLK